MPFAPTHAAVPAAARVTASRRRPAIAATAATAGTVAKVPACIIVRTGVRTVGKAVGSAEHALLVRRQVGTPRLRVADGEQRRTQGEADGPPAGHVSRQPARARSRRSPRPTPRRRSPAARSQLGQRGAHLRAMVGPVDEQYDESVDVEHKQPTYCSRRCAAALQRRWSCATGAREASTPTRSRIWWTAAPSGIRTTTLIDDIRRRGWDATAIAGTTRPLRASWPTAARSSR